MAKQQLHKTTRKCQRLEKDKKISFHWCGTVHYMFMKLLYPLSGLLPLLVLLS